ncbi:MAG: TrmH family RNA methyltransferase [Saprospiraceae bacterium]|nr:TrmH family RNA methyltransferase [Saprospiraceae bacterium]
MERQLQHEEVTTGKRHFPLVVICEDMLDPLNVGSVFRLADAMGVERLYLAGASVAPPNRKLSRTARSTEKRIPYTTSPDKILILDELAAQGYQLVGLEITNNSYSLFDCTLPTDKPMAIWLGSENTGVSAEVLRRLDFCIHIPMQGINSSMNVVQALGMALFEWNRQRTQGQIDQKLIT